MIYSNIVLITIELRILLARVHGFIDDLKGDTMNSLRNKLIASVTMLAVAAIMLTSASFAWYTVSTKGEVEKVKIEMEARNNLEIAKATTEGVEPAEVKLGDAGDETKWGSKVSQWGTVQKVQLPATVSESKLKTATYDESGRLAPMASAADANYTTLTDGIRYGYANVTNFGSDKNVAVVYGVWLRSNRTLSDVVGTIDTSAVTGSDAAKDAVTVFFKDGNNFYSSGQEFSLTADTPKYIEIVVFFDGDKIFAKDVDTTNLEADGVKVNFESATINAANTPA